jgi:RNA polymerase sigma factor (sigma-70 family)
MNPMKVALVDAAREGDARAWTELVRCSQDLAVAVAVGRSPSWDDAQDAAQEAFAMAFVHLGELRDPEAFPAWLASLVRTACSRRTRRRRLPVVPLDDVDPSDPDRHDPARVVADGDEQRRVRAAVEALAEPQRLVVALHYLAGLTYPEVGAFLGIGSSAAKKRAWTARRQLKELLPMAARALQDARPSRTERFSHTILLFSAIRRGDHAEVARLIGGNPALVEATEDWSVDEALEAGLLYAGKASALIRAAQSGDVAMVKLLVEAGAAVSDVCACAGAETALWAATLAGEPDVVAYLLEAGADPNVPAFAGATPLHVAIQRHHDSIARLLLTAGADPTLVDNHGRTPDDWATRSSAHPTSKGDQHPLVATGIRAVDLFAPLHRSGLQYWPPAYGLGQFVAIFEIARALAPARCWFIGFTHGPYDYDGLRHEIKETGVDVTVMLTPADEDPTVRRAQFEATLARLEVQDDIEKVVVCLQAPGHTHDVTVALPGLAANPSVLTTIVVAPFTGTDPPVESVVPEGYDSQIAFDSHRARRRLWPAIDPAKTLSRSYPSGRH